VSNSGELAAIEIGVSDAFLSSRLCFIVVFIELFLTISFFLFGLWTEKSDALWRVEF
jgi:hypothetical protein